MSENELGASVELSVGGGIFPAKAKFGVSLTRRLERRGLEVLQPSIEAVGNEDLDARLRVSEEVDALVIKSIAAAGCSAHIGKRKLLAKIVKRAVLDDAEIDTSLLLFELIEQLEGPHIRCLEDIHRAEQRAQASGEMPEVAPGAEKPNTKTVMETVEKYPPEVLRKLLGLDLVTGRVSWDGMALIPGTTSSGVNLLQQLHDSDI